MAKYYAPSTQGFYEHAQAEDGKESGIHKATDLPADAVQITDEEYQDFMTKIPFGVKLAVRDGKVVALPKQKT